MMMDYVLITKDYKDTNITSDICKPYTVSYRRNGRDTALIYVRTDLITRIRIALLRKKLYAK